VAITAEESFYILRFDREAYNAKLEEGAEITDEGVEEAFDIVTEIPEKSILVALTPLLDLLKYLHPQCQHSKMDRRLFHLYYSLEATLLFCRKRVVHYQPLRPVGSYLTSIAVPT